MGGFAHAEQEKKSAVGPTIGTVIIVILLIAGGLYFWGAQLNKQETTPGQIPYIPSSTTTVEIPQ